MNSFFWWLIGAVTGAGAMGWWCERSERRRVGATTARLHAMIDGQQKARDTQGGSDG